MKNKSSTDTWNSGKIWVVYQTPSAGTQIDIGLDPAGINGTAVTIANETTAPVGVVFSHPTTEGTSIAIGNLTAGDYQAIWLKRIVSSGASASQDDYVEVRLKGTT